MDWITHAALGALIGELMMARRLGKRALAWGALFGILPELEWMFSPILDTARQVSWYRGIGHSLVVMALGSWGIAHGLAKLWKREKISKAQAGAFVIAVWWVHVLVDCFTVEGAAVLWPFLDKRVSLGILAPVDFLFSGPLVAGVAWLAFLPEQKLSKGRGKKVIATSKRAKICYFGLGLGMGYALFAAGMKWVASAGFDADLARRGTKFGRRMDSPTPFNCLLWRSVVDRGDEFRVGYRSVFESRATPVRWTIYPKGIGALAKVAEMRETKTLSNVSDGWWIARPHAKGAWLGDLRFPEARVWGSKKGMVDSRLERSWVISISDEDHHLRQLSPEGKSSDYLQRMGRRAFGYRDSWEANPRLAGVAGSLPEFLAVEE